MVYGMTDWYRILGVSEKAPEEEIKAAYRKLAKRYHPDMHPGDEECERRFREISEAYSILSDPEKRRAYDGNQKKTSNVRNDSRGADPVDFQNIYKNFESFFGFNPDTKDIVNEEKLNPKKKNPLDTTDIFERFMRIRK